MKAVVYCLCFAAIAFAEAPERLYVTAEVFTDFHPHFTQFITEVEPVGSDTSIREIRVAPVDDVCLRTITIKSAEKRMRSTSPSKIVSQNNPCLVPPELFDAVLKRYSRRAGILDSVRFGIVAECGDREAVFKFPFREEVDWQGVEKTDPKVARLWMLWSEIETAAFGDSKPFAPSIPTHDAELQKAGAAVADELRSGKFDRGFGPQFFSAALKGYRGPVETPDHTPRLEHAEDYRFQEYAPPIYPPLAKEAQIEGRVELQLSVDDRSGEVRDVNVISGHPLLKDASLDAARKWRFVKGSTSPHPRNPVIDFALRCP